MFRNLFFPESGRKRMFVNKNIKFRNRQIELYVKEVKKTTLLLQNMI